MPLPPAPRQVGFGFEGDLTKLAQVALAPANQFVVVVVVVVVLFVVAVRAVRAIAESPMPTGRLTVGASQSYPACSCFEVVENLLDGRCVVARAASAAQNVGRWLRSRPVIVVQCACWHQPRRLWERCSTSRRSVPAG